MSPGRMREGAPESAPAQRAPLPPPPDAAPLRRPIEAADWKVLFKTQVTACWKKPRGARPGSGLNVVLSIKLNRDGTLDGVPAVLNAVTTPFAQTYLQSALDAVRDCQPYDLPAADYDQWRHFEPVFAEQPL